ncbi:YjcZ family sporulation protein [Brevibacillus massiliensis]
MSRCGFDDFLIVLVLFILLVIVSTTFDC